MKIFTSLINKGRAHVREGSFCFLTETMHDVLEQLARSRTVGAAIVTRAKAILLAFGKFSNQAIAEEISLGRATVGRWRRRWSDSCQALLLLQFSESRAKFERSIQDVLSDAPRSGSPGAFSAEQVVSIIAVACEPPSQSGLPTNSWTGRELATECQRRGIVSSISPSHVNSLLRQVDLQPHRSRYWCNTTEKDPVKFAGEVHDVCQTYLEAPDLYDRFNTHTACVDEMTGVQANERRAETKPPRPGQVAKEEFNYTRHGAMCVTGSWDVVEGQVIETTIEETRDNEDFARHIERTIATDPGAGWVFVVDNLNTHCGEPLVRSVARMLGVAQEELGKARRHGILKSMTSRRKFLSDRSHRIRFVYTPKHSSWLNQIEIIFGIINRRVLRRGSFKSKADLKARLERFIAYFNETFAKPMSWTYTGRPTKSNPETRPRTWREKRQTTKLREKLALMTPNF